MMLENIFEDARNFLDGAGFAKRSRHVAMGAACLIALGISGQAQAAPAGCAALQAKYPAWKGKTLVNAINPHTPGYEAIDPKDPSKYVGNPKKSDGINLSMCGAAAAENTGFVEVPLVQALIPQCKAAGKPEPTLQLYENNANCIQAILAGRADTYVNDVNTVDQAVKANPDKLEKALAVTIPYSVGIAVPKDKPEFRDAVLAALIEVQKAGIHMDLLKKWELDVNNFKEPDILSVK